MKHLGTINHPSGVRPYHLAFHSSLPITPCVRFCLSLTAELMPFFLAVATVRMAMEEQRECINFHSTRNLQLAVQCVMAPRYRLEVALHGTGQELMESDVNSLRVAGEVVRYWSRRLRLAVLQGLLGAVIEETTGQGILVHTRISSV